MTLPFHVAVGAQGDDSLANDLVSPTVTTVLPDGLAFVSGAPGCAAAGQTVTCTLGATANGATVPVTIDVRADAAGVFQDTSVGQRAAAGHQLRRRSGEHHDHVDRAAAASCAGEGRVRG